VERAGWVVREGLITGGLGVLQQNVDYQTTDLRMGVTCLGIQMTSWASE